jgi:CRP-like cAMP-binding protein
MSLSHPELRASVQPDGLPDVWRNHPFVARLRQHIELNDRELESLWRLIDTDTTVKKRRDLVVDGYAYRKFCFVEEGFAARYKLLRNGKRQIVNFVLPGDVIGMPGSFLETARYSVVAITDLKVQSCAMNAYVQLCYKQPQFGLALSWLAMHETVMCCEHTISTGRRTPVERLAHFLLEAHSRLETVGRAEEHSFVLPLSQEVMSDALGLSVPHLNRTLAKLRADGLVAMNGHQVEFLDRSALQQLGHFQPLKLMRIPVISEAARERWPRPPAF